MEVQVQAPARPDVRPMTREQTVMMGVSPVMGVQPKIVIGVAELDDQHLFRNFAEQLTEL